LPKQISVRLCMASGISSALLRPESSVTHSGGTTGALHSTSMFLQGLENLDPIDASVL